MFAWWNKTSPTPSSLRPKGPDRTLNSKTSANVHPSSGEFTHLRLKKQIERNQRSPILGTARGTTEVATELTTEPATDCVKAEEAMRRTFNLNWALPATQSLDQDVVRVWSANAPPAHRQPTAREHAAEFLQVPESVEQTGRDVGVRRTTAPARAGRRWRSSTTGFQTTVGILPNNDVGYLNEQS